MTCPRQTPCPGTRILGLKTSQGGFRATLPCLGSQEDIQKYIDRKPPPTDAETKAMLVCVDYRGFNNATVKDRYPIPLIRKTLDALWKAKFHTKLDIVAAFNRLRIAEGDEWKTAFISSLSASMVANFGMTGAPA